MSGAGLVIFNISRASLPVLELYPSRSDTNNTELMLQAMQPQFPSFSLISTEAPVYYFRHRLTERLIVVQGKLADYFTVEDIEEFTGSDASDANQRQDQRNWRALGHAQQPIYLEIPAEGEARLLLLLTVNTVQYCPPDEHLGPFRIPGGAALTVHDREYASIQAIAREKHRIAAADFRGRVVAAGGDLVWHVFEEALTLSHEGPWEPVTLNLGALPHDSYTYCSGGGRAPRTDVGMGTVTLWQEAWQGGSFYVETAPYHPPGSFPTLERLSLQQIRASYEFEFTPYQFRS